MACYKITTNAKNGACFAINTILGEGYFSISTDEDDILTELRYELPFTTMVYATMWVGNGGVANEFLIVVGDIGGVFSIGALPIMIDAINSAVTYGTAYSSVMPIEEVKLYKFSIGIESFDQSSFSNFCLFSFFGRWRIYFSITRWGFISIVSKRISSISPPSGWINVPEIEYEGSPFGLSDEELYVYDLADNKKQIPFSYDQISDSYSFEYSSESGTIDCADTRIGDASAAASLYIDIAEEPTWIGNFNLDETDVISVTESGGVCTMTERFTAALNFSTTAQNEIERVVYKSYAITGASSSFLSDAKVVRDTSIAEPSADYPIEWNANSFEYRFSYEKPITTLEIASITGLYIRPGIFVHDGGVIFGIDYLSDPNTTQAHQGSTSGTYPPNGTPPSGLTDTRTQVFQDNIVIIGAIVVENTGEYKQLQKSATYFGANTLGLTYNGLEKFDIPTNPISNYSYPGAIVGDRVLVPIASPAPDETGFLQVLDQRFVISENKTPASVVQ